MSTKRVRSESQQTQVFRMALQPAALEWRSPRIQLVFGFAIMLIPFAVAVQEFFATRFLPGEFLLAEATPPVVSAWGKLLPASAATIGQQIIQLESVLYAHHTWMYRVTDFSWSALAAVLAGLIAFEVCEQYGRRIGAAQGLFAALLCLSLPIANPLVQAFENISQIVSAVFSLFSVLLVLRYRRLKVQGYLIASVAFLILAGTLDARGLIIAACGAILSRLILKRQERPETSAVGELLPFIAVLLISAMISVVGAQPGTSHFRIVSTITSVLQPDGTSVQTGAGMVKLCRKLSPILLCIPGGIALLRLLLGSMWLRPLFFGAAWFGSSVALVSLRWWSSDHMEWFFISAPFCIFLTLAALPGADVLTRRTRVGLTIIGALSLAAIAVMWGSLLIGTIHNRYLQSRELSYFRLELSRRLAAAGEPVVVVNPPFLESTARSDLELEQMLSRESLFMRTLLDSKLSKEHLSVSLAPLTADGTVVISGSRPAATEEHSNAPQYLVWYSKGRQLLPIYYLGQQNISLSFSHSPLSKLPISIRDDGAKVSAGEWGVIPNGKAVVETVDAGIQLVPADQKDFTVWFQHPVLDPEKIAALELRCSFPRGSDGANETISLVFQGVDTTAVKEIPLTISKAHGAVHKAPLAVDKETPAARLNEDESLLALTLGSPAWLENRGIAALGLKLSPGAPCVVLKSLNSRPRVY